MKDFIDQPGSVYRYVILKGIHNTIPAVAVIVTAVWGIVAGATVLGAQIGLGALVDLAFFYALKTSRAG